VSILLQYPEFLFAGLFGIFIIFGSRDTEVHCPGWLAQPAKSTLLLCPESYIAWINQMLMYAGWRSNQAFGDIASYKLYPAIASLLLAVFWPPWVAILIGVALWFIPDLASTVIVQNRQAAIRHALPQCIDLLVLCVDAGLGLDAALQKTARDDGALASALNDELNILSREIFLGRDREACYQDLFTRTGVDELKTLGSALGQASKLGLSIAGILRAQSELVRKRRGQRAEENALRMPILMAFPLWFLIMPSLMLLVLGPSLIRFYNFLPKTVH
jgi:pilus assembly protein TadC